MKKILKNLIILIYALIAITVTIFLLSYNDFKVTELGGNTLVIIDSDAYTPDFNKGDLAIIDKSKKVSVGDEVFFYNTYAKEVTISKAKVTNAEVITPTETTYTLEGDVVISGEFVAGKAEGATKIPKIGTILAVLESKWGFLFLIVLPALLAFLYELWEFIDEIRNGSKKE